ncbi:MAG: ABC-F family ATP-binding cassette domain-containing protein [Candidatus Zixiibacteriota bacterium]
MTLLAIERGCKKFKDQIILDQVSFTINDNDRIGLVGRNGIGKTTMLEILTGKQELDSGVVNRPRGVMIDYVEQEKSAYLDMTLLDFVSDARRDLLDMRRDIEVLEHHLAEQPHDEASVERIGHLQHMFETAGGPTFENEVTNILSGLGFASDRFHDTLSTLSGGEKNRAGLARLLAGQGNLLLLDEPTNHLDIESTMWLEQYLKQLKSAYIVVSHDRTFLTNTVEKVWEISYGKLDTYSNGFEKYLTERIDRRELAEHRYRHQQEEIKRIEEFVRKNMAGQKTRQAQSRLKYLGRIKRIEAPKGQGKGPQIKVESSGRSFSHVVAMEKVDLGYNEMPVVENVSFDLYRGDRVGLIGRNGSGKSTILKALIGELEPLGGTLRLGTNVDVAYFDQELSDLNFSTTVLENIWELDPTVDVHKIKSFLARFGFTGEYSEKPVVALSGGEKTKLCLARLLYHPANFLILDEPTNHLDIDAREALENALLEYEGTCLIVSHDRFFLDRVVNRIVAVRDGGASSYPGNYSYYREKSQGVPSQSGPKKDKDTRQKQAFQDFKEQSKQKTRHKKAIVSVRSKIADLEKELVSLEEGIASGIPRHDWEKLQAASNRKQEVETQLLELMTQLDELEGTPDD